MNSVMTSAARQSFRGALFAGVAALAGFAAATTAVAQSVADVKRPATPLVLREKGSLIIGGERVRRTAVQMSSAFGKPIDQGGHVVLNQMYVQYMVPMVRRGVPLVMVHGAGLTAKTYETTPDGRMGWDEYFVRRGRPVYLVDQVGRGRSGIDIGPYNDVRAGLQPPSSLANAYRQWEEMSWKIMRFGPSYPTLFPGGQFTAEIAERFPAQGVPNFNPMLPTPNPTYKALADLAVQLDGAVLMGHSQSGAFPLEAALTNPAGVRGMILVEPGRCNRMKPFTGQEVATLAARPILVVFGDNLDSPTGTPLSWREAFNDCQGFIKQVNAAGGNASMLYPPDLGIRGNSHMIMMDRNNLQIADLILKWLDNHVDRPAPRRRR